MQDLEEKLTQESRTKVLNSGVEDSRLGPSVTAIILVNGVPMQALINTGSPATVVSPEFVLGIFVKEKEDKTPAQWQQETFNHPLVLLKAYSGHKLNILSQVSSDSRMGARPWKL